MSGLLTQSETNNRGPWSVVRGEGQKLGNLACEQ